MNVQASIQRLSWLCENIPALISQLSEEEFSKKPAPDKWSKKEILGHLIDSAANNHQRFVRVQFEDTPMIRYAQDEWNKFSYHQNIEGKKVIQSWKSHNEYIVEIWKNIPGEMLSRKCDIGYPELATLEFVINDYVKHAEHHLKEIVTY